MFTAYIIYSLKLNRYYIGYTDDVNKRLWQHNNELSAYTSRTTDWLLKYTETYGNRTDAHKRELGIKAKKSRIY